MSFETKMLESLKDVKEHNNNRYIDEEVYDKIVSQSYVNGYGQCMADTTKRLTVCIVSGMLTYAYLDNYKYINKNVKKGFNKVKNLFGKKKEKSNDYVVIYHDVEEL